MAVKVSVTAQKELEIMLEAARTLTLRVDAVKSYVVVPGKSGV